MNISEALKLGNGKAMLVLDGKRRVIEQSEEVLRWSYDATILKCPDIIRQDWMPYKQKRQIVIKGVIWHNFNKFPEIKSAALLANIYPSSTEEIVFSDDKYNLLNKPKMTMTLEWEE